MKIINGKYATAHVMTYDIEQAAVDQIQELVDNIVAEGSQVAIMPDVHAGKGCTIGTVMTIGDKIVPNLVGVDVGCGVLACRLPENAELDFEKLQRVINRFIPSGFNVRASVAAEVKEVWEPLLKSVKADLKHKEEYIMQSLGTLGGGNHFISVEVGETGAYLLIHTGSRYLGGLVAKYHQDKAKPKMEFDVKAIIEDLKSKGQQRLIAATLNNIKHQAIVSSNKDLWYLTGQEKEDYLHDMKIAQKFAEENRKTIAKTIFSKMGWEIAGEIESVHNYIDLDRGILRKGSVAAYANKPFLVPMNMKDGTLIFVAEEERPDWLFSAPHGAGRRMSRKKAKETLEMWEYEAIMEGVWSASVNENTLDEAPFAYKRMNEVASLVAEAYTYVDHLKPVFNFKASE